MANSVLQNVLISEVTKKKSVPDIRTELNDLKRNFDELPKKYDTVCANITNHETKAKTKKNAL